MDKRFDVIIIGSGAGGGTIARHLAPSGKNLLILERGDWLKRETENWDAAAVFEHNRYVSPDTWYDRHGTAFQPQVHYFVGGATKLFGAALYRLRREDFGELQHHDGISPAWPLSYEEMEPYYAMAEQMYHVHGQRGRDPTEPPASGPYPCEPMSNEPRIQQLFDDLTAAGYHPFPAPCAVMLDERNMAYSACIRCQTRLSLLGAGKVRRRDRGRASGPRVSQRDAATQCEGAPIADQRGWHGGHRGRGRSRRPARELPR